MDSFDRSPADKTLRDAVLSQQEDEKLVERARRDDPHAFAVLVTKHERTVVRAIQKRLFGDPDSIIDVYQETWLRAYQSIGQYDSQRGTFKAWIVAIAINTTWAFLRRYKSRSEDRMAEDYPSSNPGHEIVVEIRAAIRELPVQYRRVLMLKYLYGYPVAHIATLLGLTPKAVESKLFHARSRLAHLIDRN